MSHFRRSVVLSALLLIATPATGTAQVESIVRIGEVMGPEEYTFDFVVDAALAATDEIYVLDGRSAVVRVYDINGKHLRSFGRAGEGPGEFLLPAKILVDSAGVRVFDPRLDRYSSFLLNGTHVETTRNPEHPPEIDYVLPLRYGWWLGATTSMITVSGIENLFHSSRAEVIRRTPAFRRANQRVVATFKSAAELDTIAAYDNGVTWMVRPSGRRGFEPVTTSPWGRGGCFAVAGDSLVATVDTYSGDVRIFSVTASGLALRKGGRLPVTPKHLSEEDWRSAAVKALGDRPLEESTHVVGPPSIAQLGACFFDDRGALWVERAKQAERNPSSARSYLVVPSDDRPQRTVSLPGGFNVLDVRGDLVLGLRIGELDTHSLEVLRIRMP